MRSKETAFINDQIIRYCIVNHKGGCSIRNISDSIAIEYSIVHSLTQDLISQGIIDKHADISSQLDYTDKEMLVLINPKGRFFLNQEGGSIELYRKHLRRRIWDYLKIVAATLNAILIISISVWGIKSSIDHKNIEEDIKRNESVIVEQGLRINELELTLNTTKSDTVYHHQISP